MMLLLLLLAADGIMLLDEANFKTAIAENKLVLVDFFSTECPRSMALEPEFAAVGKTLAESGSKVKLAKVDVNKSFKLAHWQYNVQTYPQVKLFKNGKLAGNYTGENTESEIVTWVTSNTR